VIALAKAFPQADVRGIELSPVPYAVSRLRARCLRNVTLHRGNFFRSNLENADAIVSYLMPNAMTRTSKLLDQMLEPGTCVVTNTFGFRDRQAVAARRGSLRGAVALYIWPARRT
jgi:hypothetical protein